MNWFKNVFLKIAKMLGLEIQEKNIQNDDYSNIDSLPITATISNKLATLSLMDSTIQIIGDNERATYIDELLSDYLMERISVASEIALGTGDCLIKPYTDGQRIGIDIIKNNDFVVCESIGNFIKSCIIKCDEIKQESYVYRRFETQILKTIKDENGIEKDVLIIKQNAFKNETEIPLHSVKAWENIKEETYIANVNQLLLGRIKCPTINRNNVNGINGVKVTYGLDDVMSKVIESYNRFNQEFADKENMIFAHKSIFVRDDDGNYSFPKNKQKIFHMVKEIEDSKGLIQEYSPDIRVDALERGFDLNLKILETLCGLSAGILTAPQTRFATATEMKASLQSTFAYITKFRKFIEAGVNQLIYAINILMNANDITPLGNYEIQFDWSSSYVEQIQEQFDRLMQAQTIGAVDKAEVRSFVLDEDYNFAKQRVEEIAETEPKESDDYAQIIR